MVERELNWQRYLLLTRYHWKFLLTCALGGVVLGLFINLLILDPLYSSNAKLLIKGGKAPTFVTTLENNPEVRALTTNGNPLLTQIEVLNSSQLAQEVIDDVKGDLPKKKFDEFAKKYPDFFEPGALAKSLKLKNPASTDIITLQMSTPDKLLSKMIVQNYVVGYKEYLRKINRESLKQQGEYIQNQIAVTERKLKSVRQQLMQYRQANQTIDLANEAQASIQQLSDLETQRITLESQISARRSAIGNMKRILGMSTRQGVQSVALGMNASITEKQRELNAAMQEYESLAAKYTDENPQMESLKAKMATIQQQLLSETRRTIGHSGGNMGRSLQIADPVRSNIVNSLANTEAELQGLISQKVALERNIGTLKSQSQLMPSKQLSLSELLDNEKVLSEMVNLLKLKAAEAEFQASNDLSNVVVVQSATKPVSSDFPAPTHILLLSMMIGLLGGLAWLVSLEWLRIQALKPMKEQLATPPAPQHQTIYST